MRPLRFYKKRVVALALLAAASFCAGPFFAAHAGQDSDNNTAGGLNVAVDLEHRIVIPQIIYFRLGAEVPGNIDKVTFNVAPGGLGNGDNQTYSGGSSVPIGDGTPVSAGAAGTLPIVIGSNVGTVNLSYDLSDPLGLRSPAGNHIPFDEITVVSADPAGIPAPPLANAGSGGAISVPITGNEFNGRVVRRSTTWTYTYDNNQIVEAGVYTGRVRYTVSAP